MHHESLAGDQHSWFSYATCVCRVSTTRRALCWAEDTVDRDREPCPRGVGLPQGIVDGRCTDISDDKGCEGRGREQSKVRRSFVFSSRQDLRQGR